MRRTKIIATFGPSIADRETLKNVCEYADVIRINLAHGTWDEDEKYNHKRNIELIKKTSKELGKPVAILVDLKGNKIRISDFSDHAIDLEHGSEIRVVFTKEKETNNHEIFIDAEYCFSQIEVGDRILLDDGLIQLNVKSIDADGRNLNCMVDKGGLLRSNKGFEVEDKIIHRSGLGEEDKRDIRRLAELGIDWIALSFVNEASDVTQAREVLTEAGSTINLIAKIERLEALKQLFWIIKASDGVMVARGDLALESGPGELTGLQKDIIKQTVKGKRIAITATQMMESMISNPTPTRAEMTDVSNVVLDGTDAVMLSAETAIGKYPVDTVKAMHEVCEGAETYQESITKNEEYKFSEINKIDEAIAISSMSIARNMEIKAIVALTESGSTALMLSRYRTNIPIYAFTRNEDTQRRVGLYRGVISYQYEFMVNSLADVIDDVRDELVGSSILNSGDLIVLTSGSPLRVSGGTNSLRLIHL